MLVRTRKATMQLVFFSDPCGAWCSLLVSPRVTSRYGAARGTGGNLSVVYGAVLCGALSCTAEAPRAATHTSDSSHTSATLETQSAEDTLEPPSFSGAASTIEVASSVAAEPSAQNDDSTSSDGRDVVQGRVIDFWGHTLAGVAVGIGDERTETNERGEFTFRGIGPTYDISAVVRFLGEVVEVYGWRYEGLTRRDPTLQVYKGLSQREAQVVFDVTGLDDPSVYAEAAMGGQHGHRAYSVVSAKESLAGWRGSESVEAVVHALSWEALQGPRIPVSYLAHATSQVRLTDHGFATVGLDLTSAGKLDAADILGSVLMPREEDRVQLMFARFADGPSLMLVNEPREASADSAFAYSAPVLDDVTFTVAVKESSKVAQGEYTIGYVAGVTPGQDVGVIELKTPAHMQEPLDGTEGVTLDTVYDWETDGGTSVVVFEDLQVFQSVYVVTSNNHAKLPNLANLGIFYSNNGDYTWAVETHGFASSVDELVDPRGFLDPFSGDLNYPMGFNPGQGRFSRSGTRTFRTGKVNDSPFAR